MSKRHNDEMEVDGAESDTIEKRLRVDPLPPQADVEDIMAGITRVIDDAKVLLVADDEASTTSSTTEQVRMNSLLSLLRNKLAEIDDVIDNKRVEEGEIEEGEIEDGEVDDFDEDEEEGLFCGPCDP